MTQVRTKDLTKVFGNVTALDAASLTFQDTKLTVLVGPSGCGKTTLLRIIAGLEESTRGSVYIGDRIVDDIPSWERNIAMVFQSYALYPHMSVYRNMAFPLAARKVPKAEIKERVERTAQMLGIAELLERKPRQLSGGQMQRVAIGRAIVRSPDVFLMDEPLSNLDAKLRVNMRADLKRLQNDLGVTTIYVTHDQAEAMTLGEKIIILNRGSIQQAGKPGDIYHRPANTFVAGFVGQPQMNLFDGRLNEGGTALKAGGFQIDLPAALSEFGGADRRAPVTVGVRPEDLVPCDPREAWFSGAADFVEDLGSDRFVHMPCGTLRLVARLPARFQIQRGDTVNLKSDFERVHLFRQGRRIERSSSGT